MLTARPSLWRVMFLAEQYGRMTLTLDEVAQQIGLAAGTIKNRRAKGEFTWLRNDGRELYADVSDVAAYVEWATSKEAIEQGLRGDDAAKAKLHGLIRARRQARQRSLHCRRSSAIRLRTPPWADGRAMRALYAEAARITAETGIAHHVDHEIPLRGALVSGLHVHTNLRVLPAADNVRKNNRFEIEP